MHLIDITCHIVVASARDCKTGCHGPKLVSGFQLPEVQNQFSVLGFTELCSIQYAVCKTGYSTPRA